MEELFLEFQSQFTNRINHYKNFNSFGEDSIRYDFFNALVKFFGIEPCEIQLEFPMPNTQFESKLISEKKGRGRHDFKPEVDLLVKNSTKNSEGIIVEFAYFRKPEKAVNQDKTGKHGKILNEIFRLSLMKNHKVFNDFHCYFICVTDEEMINYGKIGTRGSTPEGIRDHYELDETYLNKLKSTALGKIDSKFRIKCESLNLIPSAKRIFKIESASSLKWEIWIWEVM
jgi:hypothetical protein